MNYLVARKLYFASVLAALAALGTKYVADHQAASAAGTIARATQAVADGNVATNSTGTDQRAMSLARNSDWWRYTSLAMILAGLIALTASIRIREPGRHAIPGLLLALAGVFQLIIA